MDTTATPQWMIDLEKGRQAIASALSFDDVPADDAEVDDFLDRLSDLGYGVVPVENR